MELIDTHAHIYDFEWGDEDDLDAMVARWQDAGVVKVYMPNLNVETLPRMLDLERRFPHMCKSMIGLHPCEVDDRFQEKLAKLDA